MEFLQSLSQIVDENCSFSQIDYSGIFGRNKKLLRLHELLLSGEVTSDDDALNILYHKSPDTSTHALRELKRRLQEKLLHCLLFVKDSPHTYNDLHASYDRVMRMYVAATALNSRLYHDEAKFVAEKAVRLAIRYEHTGMVLQLARFLFTYYSVTRPNLKKFEHYLDIHRQFVHIDEAEYSAEILYAQVMSSAHRKHGPLAPETLEELRQSMEMLENRYSDVDTYRYIRLYYASATAIAELDGNSSKAVTLALLGLDAMEAKPFNATGAKFTLQLRLLSNYIKLGDFKEAQSIASRCKHNYTSGSYNWFLVGIYSFIMWCHDGRFEDALSELQELLKSPQSKKLPITLGHFLHILKAYVHFIESSGTLTSVKTLTNKSFRIYKFINDVPLFSKDKRGMNINILIIHVLFLIWKKDYIRADDRIESLKAYSRKYLYDDATYRSNCFIKMLLDLSRADFHPVRGQRYAQKNYERLCASPLSRSRQSIEVEIIPYDDLWKIIIDMCEKNLRARSA